MARRVPPSHTWTLSDSGQPAESPAEAARRLKAAAREVGFDPVGIAPAELPPVERERLLAWLAAERHGTMGYMARAPEARAQASSLLEGARAVLMVALTYAPERALPSAAPGVKGAGRAVISTYAQGPYDYHRVLGGRLELLAELWRRLVPGGEARRFCDTAPLLERAYARAAGLGFVGKNTNLIHPRRGSFFFLGGLVLDRDLPADEPDALGSCGTCTRCLEACPTDAFPSPYQLDATRCLSYLTIEHRGPWPERLREQAGPLVFGCDVCQSVCPWNQKFAPPADPELAPDPERANPPLGPLAERVLRGFKSLARATPWERAGKRGFLRNLATGLGNEGDAEHRPLLEELAAHDDPTVAEHARWALARLDGAAPQDDAS